MRNILLLCLLLINTLITNAQKRWFITSPTEVYASPKPDAKKSGIYARGGWVELIRMVNNDWAEIYTENYTKGYILKKHIAETLHANDKYAADPDVLVAPNDTMGCAHLYVIAAGVRTKKLATKSISNRVLRTNEVFCVGYWPYNENDLVLVEGSEPEDMIFTQRKFLGKRLDFKKTVATYKQIPVTDTTKRKTLIERIFEMSWLEDRSKTLEAVNLFIEYQLQQNKSELLKDLVFEKYMLEQIQHPLPLEEMERNAHQYYIKMFIKGIPVDSTLSLKQIKKIGLPYMVSTKREDLPEVESLEDQVYIFKDFKIYYNSDKDLGYADQILFNPSTQASIQFMGKTLNHETTERAFLQAFGKYIRVDNWLHAPHTYTFIFNSMANGPISVVFKNGKLYSFSEFYCC